MSADVSEPAPTVACALVRQLKRIGVQRIFGLPGEDHLRLLDAIEAEGLQYIGAHDETAAGIMACAEADSSGLPGVLLVTHAPGITNAVNGIANAYLDALPLLVISGQHAATRYALTIRQTLDNHLLLRGVTKWSATASASIHQLLARVVSTALASPRGPVFLELREEVATQTPVDLAEDWPIATRRPLRSAEPDDIRELCRMLSEAQRPVMLVGTSDYAPEEREELKRWAQAMACPVLTSPSALGLVPESFDWFGGAFLNGLLERPLLDRSDLLVTVNLNANDFFNARWPYAAPVVAIRRDTDTERFVPRAREVIGDAGLVFQELLNAGPTSRSKWVPADVFAHRARIRAELASPADRLTVVSALEVASEVLPDDTLGARGADVRNLAELRGALAEAVDSRLPTLIGAHIDTSRHADWYSLIRA